MEITVRPAQKDDVSFIADVIIMAGRSQAKIGLWDAAFPESEKDRKDKIELLLQTPTVSTFHYSQFYIAEVNGKAACGMCGYQVKPGSGKNLIYAFREMGFDKNQINDVLVNMAPFSTCYPDTPEDAWIVECVATMPEFRKKGIADYLLRHVIDKGREQGFKKFQITVVIGNVAAKNAYLKAGFKECDLKTSPEFEKVFGVSGIERLQFSL